MASRGRMAGSENAHDGPSTPASVRTPAPSRNPLELASQIGNRSFARLVAGRRTLSRQWVELGLGLYGAYKAYEAYEEHQHAATTPAETPVRDLEPEHVPQHDDVVERGGGFRLWGAVGRDAPNLEHDVQIVRNRLAALGYPSDGPDQPALADAIAAYQAESLHFKHPDGRVDPGGQTLAALYEGKTARGLDPGPDPKPVPDPHPTPDPHPPSAPPDFSQDPVVNALPSLIPGDHVWYYAGQSSQAGAIPRDDWFKGHKKEATDYLGHGGEIYNFVVHSDHVRCAQPQMSDKTKFTKNPKYPGSFAWLNNNPGNLSGLSGHAQNINEYRTQQGSSNLNGSPPKTPGFLVFPTEEIGRDALRPWLERNGQKGRRYVEMSIWDAWQGYDKDDAPVYVPKICAALGVPPTTILKTLTDEQWVQLKAAIKQAEGTLPGWKYSRGDPRLPAAIRNAL